MKMSTGPSKISFRISEEEENYIVSSESQLNQLPTSTASTATTSKPQKKRRNLPCTPDPDAEVIALSPKALLATNRFICEVCNKGFQREQNLQLHRRGHNLPWKLRAKPVREVKKKVYLCPEPTCVHHDPSRALGDLAGIKKHFFRKHGEKKWKCGRCSKKYAVQSDWKAHSKICGTREYRCDCGTLFSRRDTFITHRAFCDALAQDGAKQLPTGYQNQSSDLLKYGGVTQFYHLFPPPNSSLRSLPSLFPPGLGGNFHGGSQEISGYPGLTQISSPSSKNCNNNNPAANFFNLGFFSNGTDLSHKIDGIDNTNLNPFHVYQLNSNILNDHINESVSSIYSSNVQNESVLPQMSAIALLHKAAQMGATATADNNETILGGSGNSPTNAIGNSWQDQRSSLSSTLPASNSSFHTTYLDKMKANLNQENHLQDIMNSLDQSDGCAIFTGCRSAANGNLCFPLGGSLHARSHENGSDLGDFSSIDSTNLPNQMVAARDLLLVEENVQHWCSTMTLGGSDRLTRDFLGVGGIVGGGFTERGRHNEQNLKFQSMDLEMKYNEGFLQ